MGEELPPGELIAAPAFSDFQKLLECPICLSALSAPIISCENGHSLCQKCRAQLNVCAFCRGKYSGRNLALENILEHCLYRCGYQQEGCDVPRMSGANLKEHMLLCEHRPVQCYMTDYNYFCKDAKLTMKTYVEHLKGVHGTGWNTFSLGDGKYTVIYTDDTRVLDFENPEEVGKGQNLILQYGQHHFVTRSFRNNDNTIFCLALVGEESIAKKFRVKIEIQPPAGRENLGYSATMSVSSIRVSKDDLLKKYPQLTISSGTLEQFLWTPEHKFHTCKQFRVNYEILQY